MPPPTFETISLHDAILVSVSLAYGLGTAVLVVDNVSIDDLYGTLTLRASGVRAMHCPRWHPWGHSKQAWILGHRHAPAVDAPDTLHAKGLATRLELELTTGDQIDVVAEAWTLEFAPRPGATDASGKIPMRR